MNYSKNWFSEEFKVEFDNLSTIFSAVKHKVLNKNSAKLFEYFFILLLSPSCDKAFRKSVKLSKVVSVEVLETFEKCLSGHWKRVGSEWWHRKLASTTNRKNVLNFKYDWVNYFLLWHFGVMAVNWCARESGRDLTSIKHIGHNLIRFSLPPFTSCWWILFKQSI